MAQGGIVFIGGYHPLGKQLLLTPFKCFRLVKGGSRRGNVGLRGVPGVSFDFGIQQRHRLPGLDLVADAHFSLDDPPADPEGKIDLVARAQMAGHDLWVSDLTFFNNDRADRADHRRRLGFLCACAQCHDRQGHRDGKSSEAEQWRANGIQYFHERLQVSVCGCEFPQRAKSSSSGACGRPVVSLASQRVAGEARKRRIVRALEHRFHVFAPIFAPDRNSSIASFM